MASSWPVVPPFSLRLPFSCVLTMKQARAAKSSTSADIVINITGRAMASDLLLVLVLLLSSITECKSRIKTVINGL